MRLLTTLLAILLLGACLLLEVVADELDGLESPMAILASPASSSSASIASCEEDATVASTTTTQKQQQQEPPRLCPTDPDRLLKISYVSRGSVDCGGALSLQQSKMPPLVKATNVDPDRFYALLLVDTTVLGILHYAAVNIPGSALLEGLSLDRSDSLTVVSPYRGPSSTTTNHMDVDPRAMLRPNNNNSNNANNRNDTGRRLFWYEFFLGVQSGGRIETPPKIDTVIGFDFQEFFEMVLGIDTGGFFEDGLTATTHFRSGSCVKDPVVVVRDQIDNEIEQEEETEPLSTTVNADTPPQVVSSTATTTVVDVVRDPDDINETEETEPLLSTVNTHPAVSSTTSSTTTRPPTPPQTETTTVSAADDDDSSGTMKPPIAFAATIGSWVALAILGC